MSAHLLSSASGSSQIGDDIANSDFVKETERRKEGEARRNMNIFQISVTYKHIFQGSENLVLKKSVSRGSRYQIIKDFCPKSHDNHGLEALIS